LWRLRTEERLSLRKIGERFDRSPERVRQIIKQYCYTTGAPYPARVKQRKR
jgi:hypothetical protein